MGLPWIPVSTLWRTLRKICNTQLFSIKKLSANQNLRRRKVEELLANVRRSSLTDPDSEDFFPLLRKIDPLGLRRSAAIHFRKIFDLLDRIMNERLQFRKSPGSVKNNDALNTLLDITEENSEAISKTRIQHLLLRCNEQVLFVAGTDTTASTFQWAMAELLKNPEIKSKAKAELEQTIGKRNPVEESDIARLYLQAIVKETFRLHPVVPLLLPRKAEADVEIGGCIIPKDAKTFVNVWAIGRDSSTCDNPNSFKPDRFLGSEMDVKGRSFEPIPFGGGRRICPGLPLAMRMLHLMLGSVINSFDWKLEDGTKPEDMMNMEDKFRITLDLAHPLRAVPVVL
ncbi:hypothetical protein FEM48_Zijuj11G0048100 [Ziziphus jujuba var. spinosa]|uniref:Geraniol 8-hydroxylase-like n=1 Tax=Ziziphus jujuba var. spinosa TaxID=714518 RepID=A0A978UGX6_ZIZJJ|nr:hypothetical protein FEM48_Zijuj11G0048100 [Ziziphus jujuba var. spinosa]